MKRFLITLVLIAGISFSISAQQPQFNFPEFTQIELSKSDVDRFINKFPSMQADFEKLDHFENNGEDLEAYMNAVKANAEANRIAKKHGYADMTSFVNITWTIATSYAALHLKQESMPGMEEAIKQIESNQYMSAEEKAAAIEQMKIMFSSAQQSFANLSSEKNMQVVAPYTEKLRFLFDDDEQ